MDDGNGRKYWEKNAYIRFRLLAVDRMAASFRSGIRYNECGSVYGICGRLFSSLFVADANMDFCSYKDCIYYICAKLAVLPCFLCAGVEVAFSGVCPPCPDVVYGSLDGMDKLVSQFSLFLFVMGDGIFITLPAIYAKTAVFLLCLNGYVYYGVGYIYRVSRERRDHPFSRFWFFLLVLPSYGAIAGKGNDRRRSKRMVGSLFMSNWASYCLRLC